MLKMSKTGNNTGREFKYPSKTHWSFGLGAFLDQFYVSAFTVRVIYYYENELLLSIILVGLAFGIYGLWNMINDPLLGWLSDKKTRFTNRWGRRFPWFIIGAFLINIIYIFIYIVPFTDQLGVFVWLLITICVYEFCYSLWQVNWLALYPDKFRSQEERTKVGAISTIWAQIGTVIGILIPPLLISYGNIRSYLIAAVAVAVIGLISVVFIIPGMREDYELIEREKQSIEIHKKDNDTYWIVLKDAVKQRNFLSYILFYLFYYSVNPLLLASIPFWVIYIMGSKNPNTEIILAGCFLIGAFLGVPIWLKTGRRIGNRKTYMYGSLMAILFAFPLLFVSDFIITILFILLFGFAFSSMWTLLYPGFSEVIDELVVKTGKHREGAYTGIRTFIGRMAYVIQAITFAIVHQVTLFKPGAPTQAPLALWGIRIIMVLAPMICFFICFILMAFFNDLTPEKVKEYKAILKEKNL